MKSRIVTIGLLLGSAFLHVVLLADDIKTPAAANLWPEKVVVAHRGASGYLPEHTLPAKAMAYAMGAQYLEQDVVMSKDDQLIVLHDITLNRTTDVAEKFPARSRADGQHYVVDFTLEEMQQLNVTESLTVRNGQRQASYPERFPPGKSSFRLHTLAQEIELIQGLNQSTGKNVGIYPEIKAPAFHRAEGKDISAAIVAELKRYGYTSRDHRVYLQTFDFGELKRVREKLLPEAGIDLKLVQLIGNEEWMLSSAGIAKIAAYADGVGPEKGLIISPESSADRLIISDLVSDAHAHGMSVHPYTFRQDSGQIPDYARDFEHLLELFFINARVDGIFTDFPDRAVEFLQRY